MDDGTALSMDFWRQAPWILHEPGKLPSEKTLQAIWHHQRLQRNQLHTLDGRRLRVLHPGFWNREAGPDFKGAVLQWEGGPALTGDVEIDLVPSLWQSHHHQGNPDYAQTILHVVWEGGGTSALPVLELQPHLDAPLEELTRWMQSHQAESWPDELLGQCNGPLRQLPKEAVSRILLLAADHRLESKAMRFAQRAREAGWDQALWEGLFTALGYKNNYWPMLRLAELREPLVQPGAWKSLEPVHLQARLMGISGQLPSELKGNFSESDRRAQRLRELWWMEESTFSNIQFPGTLWRRANLRPANHPQGRLALLSHWLLNPAFLDSLQRWLVSPRTRRDRTELENRLQVADEFWQHHYTLASRRSEKPRRLLGRARSSDIVMNIFLPWELAQARSSGDEERQARVRSRYFAWPKLSDNAVLRLARQRLLGDEHYRLPTGAHQQGLLQIVRNFCEHSNAVCAECPFPEWVRTTSGANAFPHPRCG